MGRKWEFPGAKLSNLTRLSLRGLRYLTARPRSRKRGRESAPTAELAESAATAAAEDESKKSPGRAQKRPVAEVVEETTSKKAQKRSSDMTAAPSASMATGEHKREEGAAGENGDAGTVWCIECEDVAASVRCEACGGDYFCGRYNTHIYTYVYTHVHVRIFIYVQIHL